MLEKLAILRQAWQQPGNKRATGGTYALSGFDYQFTVFLLRYIKRFYNALKNEEQFPAHDSLSIETISDVTELTPEGLLFITQVKLGANEKFDKIFSEFWGIFELAKQVIPGDEDKLHFKLCTSRISSSDIRAKFRLWAKREKKSEMSVSEFERHIHAEVIPQPEDEIMHILIKELRDDKPVEHLRAWKGCLLSATKKENIDSAIKEIWKDLIAIANRVEKREVPIHVWQSTDRPPSEVVYGEVLTGTQPLVYQLRKGFFAPRPNVYADLAESYSEWRQSLLDNTDVSIRLPVFWIGGRSGTGKSIALLHLLANIHSEENVRIFWLQQSIQYLPDAIRWAVSLRKQGYDTIIAADDPFAPATQQNIEIWQRAFDELNPLRSQGEVDSMPVLLCCGPTEHGQNLRDEEPDNVDVTIKKLEPEDQTDYEILRSWYKKRTGNEPPAVGDENVLLVQLFFEWKTKGPLPEFAKRFKDRINEADPQGELFKRFSKVLAANRLYIGYPSEAFRKGLSLKHCETIELLTQENHLADMNVGRKGIWLAHPHLSNAIYEAWFPADRPPISRDGHLADIINDSFMYEKKPFERMAPLWAISRALDEERLGPSDFRREEFGGAVTISGLCKSLSKDGYRPRTRNQINTLDWLNDVLKMPDLYSRIQLTKSSQPPSANV
ncbi:MAG: hypothetical protein OEW48_18570, partial [Phycisphaerae bacterium]|nr:hypothetical protein [Phycisphaerae bacterium]